MSVQRYDVLSARTYVSGGEERKSWDKVGVAFQTKDGTGYSVKLHLVPVAVDGTIQLLIKPFTPRDDSPPPRSNEGAPF